MQKQRQFPGAAVHENPGISNQSRSRYTSLLSRKQQIKLLEEHQTANHQGGRDCERYKAAARLLSEVKLDSGWYKCEDSKKME